MHANMRFNTESYNVRQNDYQVGKISRSIHFIGVNSE